MTTYSTSEIPDDDLKLSQPTARSRTWMKTALWFFFLASLFGLGMRYFFMAETPEYLEYRYFMHAHSHVAMLGWGFMLIAGALIFLFPHPPKMRKPYRIVYLANTFATLGMAVSFVLQGYSAISITFSAIHLFTVYYFGYLYWRQLRGDRSVSARFIRLAIFWYFLSSLGLLSLGPIGAIYGKHSSLYYEAIQWFMHFQLNGWFIYATLGILFRYMGRLGYPPVINRYALPLLNLSLMLTFALSITWSHPLDWLFYLNTIGVVSQTVGFFLIVKPLILGLKRIHPRIDGIYFFIMLGVLSILFKAVVQMVVVIPFIAVISYTIRNYVIAFFHLITLGAVTFTIGGVLLKQGLFPVNTWSKWGWGTLALGFIATETLLFGQGTLFWMGLGFIPNYYNIIFFATLLLPLGILIILTAKWQRLTTTEHKTLKYHG